MGEVNKGVGNMIEGKKRKIWEKINGRLFMNLEVR
jgi:hypothetical protein